MNKHDILKVMKMDRDKALMKLNRFFMCRQVEAFQKRIHDLFTETMRAMIFKVADEQGISINIDTIIEASYHDPLACHWKEHAFINGVSMNQIERYFQQTRSQIKKTAAAEINQLFETLEREILLNDLPAEIKKQIDDFTVSLAAIVKKVNPTE